MTKSNSGMNIPNILQAGRPTHSHWYSHIKNISQNLVHLLYAGADYTEKSVRDPGYASTLEINQLRQL